MKNEKWLTDDHQIVNTKIQEVLDFMEKGFMDTDKFSDVERSLKKHIYFEETILFPALDKGDLRIHQMIEGLKMEHAALWKLMDVINKEIEEEKFVKSKKSLSEMLLILKTHNENEEGYIYNKIVENTDVDVVNIESLQLPNDFICEKLRNRRIGK